MILESYESRRGFEMWVRTRQMAEGKYICLTARREARGKDGESRDAVQAKFAMTFANFLTVPSEELKVKPLIYFGAVNYDAKEKRMLGPFSSRLEFQMGGISAQLQNRLKFGYSVVVKTVPRTPI